MFDVRPDGPLPLNQIFDMFTLCFGYLEPPDLPGFLAVLAFSLKDAR
jgi:hypothetical protein